MPKYHAFRRRGLKISVDDRPKYPAWDVFETSVPQGIAVTVELDVELEAGFEHPKYPARTITPSIEIAITMPKYTIEVSRLSD